MISSFQNAIGLLYRFGWAAALSVVIFAILFILAQVFLKNTRAT
jgi:arabinogalactan oligomer/maltooligosaccharide transport system permease protein